MKVKGTDFVTTLFEELNKKFVGGTPINCALILGILNLPVKSTVNDLFAVYSRNEGKFFKTLLDAGVTESWQKALFYFVENFWSITGQHWSNLWLEERRQRIYLENELSSRMNVFNDAKRLVIETKRERDLYKLQIDTWEETHNKSRKSSRAVRAPSRFTY